MRITLKKPYTDGTIAVDMDPLSLLCRLALKRASSSPAHPPLRDPPGRSLDKSSTRTPDNAAIGK